MHYLALVFRDDDEGYGFTVPDVPGFTAHAENAGLDKALAVARGVLADHLAAMVDADLPLPEARPPEVVIADPEVQDDLGGAVATVLLPAILPAGRTLRVNVTMDEHTLSLVDGAAGERKLTRSAFVAEACRRFAVGENRTAAPQETGTAMRNVQARVEETARRIEEMLHEATGTGNIFARGREARKRAR
jgi:predicted RNase H-like HicB family nuclease